jgi:hypothetical protein
MEELMGQIETLNRKALGILSYVMDEQLGASNLVSREVSRAFETGVIVNLNRASLLFDTLPGWQKSELHKQAKTKAHNSAKIDRTSTARDWSFSKEEMLTDLPPKRLRTRLPIFLME